MAISVRQGEAKPLTFTYTDSNGDPIDVSSHTFSFWVRVKLSDSTNIISKADGDFDKSNGASGIVSINLSTTDTANDAIEYISQITRQVDANNIYKKTEVFTIVEADRIVTLEQVKMFLQITDNTYDTYILSVIPYVEEKYENIRGIPFDVDSNDITEYPPGCELTASQMVGYLIQTSQLTNMTDKKSESIGSYSYTRGGTDDMVQGFPKSIVSQIERYVNPKT